MDFSVQPFNGTYQFPSERVLSQKLTNEGLPQSTAKFLASSLGGQKLSRQAARRSVDQLTADRKENFLQRRIFLALREASDYHETHELSFPDAATLSYRLTHLNRNRLNHLDKKLYAIVVGHFANIENISEEDLNDDISWLVIADRPHFHRRCCVALNHSHQCPKPLKKQSATPLKTAPQPTVVNSPLDDSSLQRVSPVVA